MVGLPASGKSTRVRELLAVNPDVFVYSTDNLIEDWAAGQGWTYNFAFAKYIDKATSEMNRMLDTAIRERMDIIWDQTNLGAKKRTKIINRMRNAGYRVECECIRPPMTDAIEVDEWMKRLVNRPGKTISDSVMSSMMDSYVKPTDDEGFDVVRCYDMYGNCV
jgi:tRNA uridine 5-carbamoylmethylation protein Kti12